MTMGKMFLMGQAPPHYGGSLYALYPYPKGCAGYNLCSRMGLGRREYLRLFDRENVLDDFPGADAGGDKFPLSVAKKAVLSKMPRLHGRKVLIVGIGTSKAFNLKDPEFLTWGDIELGPFKFEGAIVPHTSGRNRWWNEPENAAKGEAFLRSAVDDARKMIEEA